MDNIHKKMCCYIAVWLTAQLVSKAFCQALHSGLSCIVRRVATVGTCKKYYMRNSRNKVF